MLLELMAGGLMLYFVLGILLFGYSECVRGIKHYVKTFSLRNEWEALKSVKFYKEK